MKCEGCETELNPRAQFCSKCGKKVERNEIEELCERYFSVGLSFGIMRAMLNKKETKEFLKEISKIYPKLAEIYKNPFNSPEN